MFFNLPGSEEDWWAYDSELEGSMEGYTFYPEGEDLDATNSWIVNVYVTVANNLYDDVTVDGEEPTDEGESVLVSENGMRWFKSVDGVDFISYGTCLDEYLDGYRIAEINIMPNGFLEDGEEPDNEVFEKIEKTLINSFEFDSDYEGKPDYTDAAYTGSLLVKWPFEIPFENGQIKAEQYVDNYQASVYFTYEDPENEDISYEVELTNDTIYDPDDYGIATYIEHAYFGEDPFIGEEEFEEIEITGNKAVMRFNYDSLLDEMVVEINAEEGEKHPVLDMFTYIVSENDEDRADEKNKQKIIDTVTAIVNSAEFLD